MTLQTDLFRTKKDLIEDFIRQRHWVKTHEIIAYGLSIFTNRGDRYARDLAQEGKIRRMPDNKKQLRFGDLREDVWEWCGEKFV